MDRQVFVRIYEELPFDEREALRYAGGGSGEDRALLRSAWEECRGGLEYRVCWSVFGVKRIPEERPEDPPAADRPAGAPESGREAPALDLGFSVVRSKDLAGNLEGCGRVILFAATAGFAIDRKILSSGRISPSKALMFQAIGSAQAEVLCGRFCADMEKEYGRLRPRFSPGYGDLPLELQRDIFRALGPEKRIGVTLNESLLMTPSKSVTAIAGIEGPAEEI